MSTMSDITGDRRKLLEQYLHSDSRGDLHTYPAIPPRPPGTLIPLSIAQLQVWLHAQMASHLPIYNESITVHRRGPLTVPILERCFVEIIRRHEAWRTTFDTVNGQPFQIVQPPPSSIRLPYVDLRVLPVHQREGEATRLATDDASRPFDLKAGPLWRATLVRIGDDEHRIYMTLHQIILDGITAYHVFLPELVALYSSLSAGKPPQLPELPIQYGDYALWQRQRLRDGLLDDQIAYWRHQLSGDLPVLHLPTDRPRPSVQTFRGEIFHLAMSGEVLHSLQALSKSANVTLFMTLLAGFVALLDRYSGQHDVIIGSVTAGRTRPEIEKLLGSFVNPVVLRIDTSGNPTFRELIVRVRDVVLGALSHQEVPFDYLVKELQSRRDASRNPLFQILFSLEPPISTLDPGWDMTQFDVCSGASKLDLYVNLDERRDGIIGPITYNPDLFDAATIERMMRHWQTLLLAAAAEPELRVVELPLLAQSELQSLIANWNAPGRLVPNSTIHALFEEQVERSVDASAVVFDDQEVSYRELNRRANQLARYLKSRGVGPEVLVGLCVERSLDMVVAMLGILKAGGAYVPLNPAFPKDRLSVVIEDARPRIVVTQQRVRLVLPESNVEVVCLDSDAASIAGQSDRNLETAADPSQLAYVIYTSGSTGVPKGVQIEHRSVVNFLCSMQREPGICADDVLLAVTTLSFDIAGLEIYLPLITGARLAIARPEVARDGRSLAELLHQSGATIMQATPVTWRMLVESGWKGSPGFRTLCGGEAMSTQLAGELRQRSGEVWNLYGPTETTIWSSLYRVPDHAGQNVPIGMPIDNTQLIVLDPDRRPVPTGVSGEICIGGAGLARGYLNRPELTAEKFIPDPFSQRPARLCRTGDLGRFRNDGNLEYVGRIDQQIKLRGFRIEPGEIETMLAKHPGVKGAVASVVGIAPEDTRLMAHVVLSENAAVTAESLRRFLLQKLPEYMVPSHIVMLDAFPVNATGKIDRKALSALPLPEASRSRMDGAFEAPRDELETRLAEIWENVLGISPIGIRDDFFSIGGHSLIAVRLFGMIESSLGKKIPLGALIEAPTIEQLAALIRNEGRSDSWSWMVPVQQNGSLPPLFCVHAHSGEILFYRELSQYLGPQQPFFAFQAQGREDLASNPTIELMAANYLAEARKLQPKGPYFIGGYCFGALIAFEMAHQLVRSGETVAFLGLLLGHYPKFSLREYIANKINLHLTQLRRLGTRAKLGELKKNSAGKLEALQWRLAYRIFGDRMSRFSPFFRNVPERNRQAARKYVPAVYPGRMTVFLSCSEPSKLALDPKLDLGGMQAHQMEVRVVPGDRDTMLHEPFVGPLAGEIQECLRHASAANGSRHQIVLKE